MLNFNNIHISHGCDTQEAWKNVIIPKGEIVFGVKFDDNETKKIISSIEYIYVGIGKTGKETPKINFNVDDNISDLNESIKTLNQQITNIWAGFDEIDETTIDNLNEIIALLNSEDGKKITELSEIYNQTYITLPNQIKEVSNQIQGGQIVLGEPDEKNTLDITTVFSENSLDTRYVMVNQGAENAGRILKIDENGYITTFAPNEPAINSWQDIAALTQQGLIQNYLEINDLLYSKGYDKEEDEFTLLWKVIGFNHEYYKDDEGNIVTPNSITLQLWCIFPDFRKKFEDGSGEGIMGEWKDSSVRTFLQSNENNGFLEMIDPELHAVIKPVYKKTYDSNQTLIETVDIAFLPSCSEVGGYSSSSLTKRDEGLIYPAFKSTNTLGQTYNNNALTVRIINTQVDPENTKGADWLLRSYNMETTNKCINITNTGAMAYNKNATSYGAVCPCVVIY